jgi:hypothetical protein
MNIQDISQKKLISIKMETIPMEPGPYCMSYGFDVENLKRSVAGIGLLNPPLVVQGRGGQMEIVSGYRRLLACRALGWQEITCFDISATSLGPLDCLLLNFHDNLATRALNLIEKGMFLKRISSFFTEEKIIKEYLPLIGLPSHAPTLHFFLKMEELTDEQRQEITDNKLSLPAIKALVEMDPDSRSVTFDCIIKLNLNFNQQLQLIEFLGDISIKMNITIHQLFKTNDLIDILNAPQINKPQKAKFLLDHLQAMRYPRLVKVERTFQQQIDKLNLPKFARIQHSPGFEDVHCKLTIDFQNGGELKQRMLFLSQLESLEKLKPDVA